MPQKQSTAEEALSSLLSNIEDFDLSDYSNDSNFELETDHSLGESENSDHDTLVVRNVLPAALLQPRRRQKEMLAFCLLRLWIFL